MISNTSSVPHLQGGFIDLGMIKRPLKNTSDRRTKIVCTLGPACWSEENLSVLIDAGMNVARFNFSHGDHISHGSVLDRLRSVAAKKARNIAVLLDTKGPEIRSGFFHESNTAKKIVLVKGETIILTSDYSFRGDATKLGCSYEKLASSVTPGQQILVADGSLVLSVLECDVADGEVLCRIENNATIGERKNMNLPGVKVDLPTFTEKDVEDIVEFGVKKRVEFVAASFVRKAEDVQNLRRLLNDNGGSEIKIISKIENQEGLENYTDILRYTDAVMVARGDLGMEIPPAKVCLAQKLMIRGANVAGKPVITATQMLESMITNMRPTRAECSDVANAVYDGTDAVMLSGETANGPYFQQAVEVMARTCCEAERSRNYSSLHQAVQNSIIQTYKRLTHGESVASTAVKASIDVDAKLIVVLSSTGKMAHYVAKFRPNVDIMCLTPDLTAARQASGLLPGMHTILVDKLDSPDELIEDISYELVKSGALQVGDRIVVIGGLMSGYKEQLRLVEMTEGKVHGHIIKDSDEFFFNPKMVLRFDSQSEE